MNNADNTVEDLIDRAERLEVQGKVSEALQYWREVLERERDPVYLCRFGRLAMKADKSEEARRAFLDAMELDPGLPYVYDCLGIWHDEQGNQEESLSYFNKSLRIEETSPTYTLLGAA